MSINIPVTALYIGSLLSVITIGSAARAADAPAANDSITFHGLTIFGVVDLGFAYQTHGTPLNSNYYTGLEYVISKNSNKSVLSIAPSGLSQSKVGLSGLEPLPWDWSFVFKLETDFNPQSASLADSSKSMVANAGVPLNQQTTNTDGNKNGQLFAGAAYGGVSNEKYGTLTFGRQTSTLSDTIVLYDPQAGSYAFSVLGYSGFTTGGGDTQDVRLDDTLKYRLNYRNFHVAALYQFKGADGYAGGAGEADIGMDYGPFSADMAFSHVNDAVSASTLSAAQLANPLVPGNSLAATVSDNTAYTAMARYALKPATLFAGYEHITYANPSDPLTGGFSDEGGYQVTSLLTNNSAYTHKRQLDIFWTGFRYPLLSAVDLSGAYYHINQNSYHGDGCSTAAFAQCSGHEDALSLVIDYRFAKHWDAYLGSMYSVVADGMASGFLHNSNVGTMSGVRFTF